MNRFPTIACRSLLRTRPSLLTRRLLSAKPAESQIIYTSPTEKPVRLLKLFCVSGTALTFLASPLLLFADASLPLVARLTAIAFATLGTGSTTAFVARYFGGFVSFVRRDPQTGDLTFATTTLLLKPRLTTVYDKAFIVPAERPGAKYSLAEQVAGEGEDGAEETVAQTTDAEGRVLGRWIVRWEQGVGRCRAAGEVVRDFQLHEEMLTEPIARAK
ncbi:hypothetical protein EXIGLDRAFT_832595 [Exidia glandulosa HHB12029]|uniref:Uncharacterized protein n=1 Tax=Exidia glandulosa HHB12029 TaxID=1314781 RepID=A0A165LHE9_EXIGL|nr:hypothetical protein EXIGLDRAFT_832595 [Exidia glandulosa HHB12029]